MYRTIGTEIWTDPKFRALNPMGRYLFIYLFTNPHAHVGGIYYLPNTFITHETGIDAKKLDTLWDTLSGVGLVWRDKESELVWVKNMLKRQGMGEKLIRSTANQLKTLHNCSAIPEFLKKYPGVKKFYRDRVSKGYPESGGVGIQEQEQEQEHTGASGTEDGNQSTDVRSLLRKACREAFGQWSSVDRGFGIRPENREHEPIHALIDDLATEPPVVRGCESVPRETLIPLAAQCCKRDRQKFEGVKYACATVRNLLEKWAREGIPGVAASQPAQPRDRKKAKEVFAS